MYSCAWEQTEANANMLFVMSAMRNVQKAQKRSWGCVLSKDDLIQSCHHELRNLQISADMWWCTRDHLRGPQWFDCPKGCAFCEKMFNVGDKWMRMLCVKKIRGFLFPVSWMSELRVQQNELDLARFFGPRTDGGGWSVVMCWHCCDFILGGKFLEGL